MDIDNGEALNEIKTKARDNHVPIVLDQTSTFLAEICFSKKPTNILEIGTAVGYSGIIMLLNSGNQSMLTTIELDEDRFLQARQNFKLFNIEPRTMQYLCDAKEVLPWLDDNEYDFIFCDGPKGQYIKYLPYLKKLLKSGGTLVADNVYFKGMVNSDGEIPHKHRTIVRNLKMFNDTIKSDSDFETNFYDIGDGICVAVKK